MIRPLGLGAVLLGCAATATGTPPVKPSLAKTWLRDVRLVGLECGDNCWLHVKNKRGRPDSVLCHAPQCDSWMRAEQLPRSMVGKRVRMTLRMCKAMSGDVEMAQSEEVIGLVFLK